jgi:hypothetical protein
MITRETVLAAFEKRLADDPLVSAEWHAFARADLAATFAACRELTADESAYYEFVCKQAGIRVLYCAERFENDGSLCEEVHLNLAYRWFCRLGLDGEVPDLCVPKT